MDDPFNFPELRVRQPAKILPRRASYEISGDRKQLLAVATETEGRSVMDKIARLLPDTRVLSVTTPAGVPVFTLTCESSRWRAGLAGADGTPAGKIRIGRGRRHYTLIDDTGAVVAEVAGDLAVRRFVVTGPDGTPFAEIRKTFAGPVKESVTSSDNYMVKFAGPTEPLARTLTVMVPIVLDLVKYGPT